MQSLCWTKIYMLVMLSSLSLKPMLHQKQQALLRCGHCVKQWYKCHMAMYEETETKLFNLSACYLLSALRSAFVFDKVTESCKAPSPTAKHLALKLLLLARNLCLAEIFLLSGRFRIFRQSSKLHTKLPWRLCGQALHSYGGCYCPCTQTCSRLKL